MQLLAALEDPHPTAAYVLIAMMMSIVLLYFAFWLWMLVDAISNEPAGSKERVIWPLIIFFLGGFAALIYNVSRRKQRIKLYGR
jgi:uncharacterized RDD family membrane protein YckC